MRKIISISLDENTIKRIDEARGLATRSKFIESMLMVAEWKCQDTWNSTQWVRPPEFPEKSI